MAATTAFSSLAVPAPTDDNMEMSSPGNHDLDEDIDFDDYEPGGGGVQVNDDERMIDDGDQIRPATATDDMMDDDAQQAEQIVVQEEVMHDSPPLEQHAQQEEDEELIDYSDDDLQDEVVEDAEALEGFGASYDVTATFDVPEEQPSESAGEATAVTDDTASLSAIEEQAQARGQSVADLVSPADDAVQNPQAVNEPSGGTSAQDLETATGEQTATDEDKAEILAISLDTAVETPADGPATPTDTGLHPMTVRFGDFQFPLFKSRNQPEGLLKNDNLASLSLGELIQNCRERLAIKTGEKLSQAQDLVLGFDQLRLALVEDSRAAFESSLDEVLDVYIQLHQNDGAEQIAPFALTLSLQLKFASSLSVLKQAAAGGQGMSSFGFLHAGGEQAADYHDEYAEDDAGVEGHVEYDEEYDQTENTEDQEELQAAVHEGSIPEQQEANTNEYTEHDQGQQVADQAHEDYDQDFQENEDPHEEFGEDQYYDENQDDATQLLDDHGLEGDRQVQKSADAVLNAPDEVAAEETAQSSFGKPAVEEKNESAATSTTFQGDQDQQTTGKYTEEDLIDWGDDDVLTSDPSEQSAGGYDDVSTFLVEAEVGDDAPEAQPGVGDLAQDDAGPTNQELDAVYLGSEDYLEDQTQDEGAQGVSTEQQEAYEQDLDQADEVYEQQEQEQATSNQDQQPEEDDAEIHTAYDLLDGEDYKHGLVHQDADQHAEDTQVAATSGQQYGEDDFIDFDEDETTLEQKPETIATANGGSRTPVAKRSFEDLADDEIDFDSPDPKKARAS